MKAKLKFKKKQIIIISTNTDIDKEFNPIGIVKYLYFTI